jgi:hypothetical protein
MTELMQGAQFAKSYVNTYLTCDLPNRLNRYRNGWNLDDRELPEPELYLTYEPIALDHWPMIITVVISGNRFERMMLGSQGDPLYRVSYSMRTYIWTKTEGSEAVTLMRDRLTTVVRSAFLDRPSLNRHDDTYGCDAYIDESGLVEEFSDLTLIKGERVLAGAYLGYDLVLNEIIYRDQIKDMSEEGGVNVDLETFNLRDPEEQE